MMINSRRPDLSKYVPLAVAIAAFGGVLVQLFIHCQRNTSGHYVYPLDDSYIHMAIAKNLAHYGVWGVTRYSFGAASSSPLWTLVLAAGFKLFGVHDLLPVILCSLLSVAVLAVINDIARRERVSPWVNAGLLLVIVMAAPLPLMALLGMEHVAQILIDLMFLYVAARAACHQGPIGLWNLAVLALLSALTSAVRYEGLFLIGGATFLFLLRRRWAAAAMILLAGFVPVVVFAVFSIRHGGFWLPNSVMIKGNRPPIVHLVLTLGTDAIRKLIAVPAVLIPLIIAVAILALTRDETDADDLRADVGRGMLLISVITALGHLEFAKTGHLLRYEAYLIVLLLVSIAVAFSRDWFGLRFKASVNAWSRVGAFALAILILAIPLIDRARDMMRTTPKASRNIFDQQVQFARFLKKYYNTDVVELNDIGAAGFYSDIHLVDEAGLDGSEVANMKLHHEWNTEAIDKFSRRKNVKIVITFEWGVEPSDWIKVGSWKITDNHVCAKDTVTFYATHPKDADALAANLREFKSQLPASVQTWTR